MTKKKKYVIINVEIKRKVVIDMTEKEVTRILYVTADGREYSSKINAIKREKELAQKLDPKLLAIVLSEKCNTIQDMEEGCKNCPFFENDADCILRVWDPWEWNSNIC